VSAAAPVLHQLTNEQTGTDRHGDGATRIGQSRDSDLHMEQWRKLCISYLLFNSLSASNFRLYSRGGVH
jgi:hypothetical protein